MISLVLFFARARGFAIGGLGVMKRRKPEFRIEGGESRLWIGGMEKRTDRVAKPPLNP